MENNFERISALIGALEQNLIERRHHVRLSLLAALSGEHTLLIGPPGTAKSELARRLHNAFGDARYFERLLTRFSVPEELFGPLSIQALEQDRYERHTAGFLPDASIAFIDEVFKANSAILNALLTLLNEREFDNGAGRQACPLISCIGATNNVPEDEVTEAFLDRFLLRLPVAPVSDEGFTALLNTKIGAGATAPAGSAGLMGTAIPAALALNRDDLATLDAVAAAVDLSETITAVLADLRRYCVATQIHVSDRRWVKIVRLLRVAAATTGRTAISQWELLLLPFCTAPDTTGQGRVAEWLTARLGVREAFSPARLTRVVEAFEAQLDAENRANDLDYDESGRLKFTATDQAGEMAEAIGDAKRGAAALRMTHSRRRCYGATHIGARTRQIDAARERIAGYAQEIAAQQAELTAFRARNLWLDDGMLDQVATNLTGTAIVVADLDARIATARAGFLSLPRLDNDDGRLPEPVDCELLSAA